MHQWIINSPATKQSNSFDHPLMFRWKGGCSSRRNRSRKRRRISSAVDNERRRRSSAVGNEINEQDSLILQQVVKQMPGRWSSALTPMWWSVDDFVGIVKSLGSRLALARLRRSSFKRVLNAQLEFSLSPAPRPAALLHGRRQQHVGGPGRAHNEQWWRMVAGQQRCLMVCGQVQWWLTLNG